MEAIGAMLSDLIKTLLRNIVPSSICAVFIMFFIMQLKNTNVKTLAKRWINSFKKSRIFRWQFLFFTYFYMLLYKTLFSRTFTSQDPLKKIMEGWTVQKNSNGNYDFECVENIILFIPYMFLFFKAFYSYSRRHKTVDLVVNAFLLSFFSSLIIEIIQLIFKIGTFQIADLTYNTLGGVIGVILFIGYNKIAYDFRH